MIVVAWVFYGALSAAGVENAGNIAAYTAMGVCATAGLVLWFRDEVMNVKTCPACKSDVPGDATVCAHCRHHFDG